MKSVMSQYQENLALWANDLISRKAWVVQLQTYAVGQAKAFYDGLGENVYVSKANGQPVKGAVLELESGHALLADPEKWAELTVAEVNYFQALQTGFSGLIMVAAKNAKTSGVDLERGLSMLKAILRAQLAALEA